MFIDESGFLMAPTVRRTWAPKGQTPLLRQGTRHYRKVSVIGGLSISPVRRRLRLFLNWHVNANVTQVEVVRFLRELLRHLRGPVIVIWDRLNAHRSRYTRAFIMSRDRLATEFLPAYAPELNAIEGVWGDLKYHRMPNHGIDDVDELATRAEREAEMVGERQDLLRSFVARTDLPIRLSSTVHSKYRLQ